MSDEDKTAIAIGKGGRADALLSNDIFNEAFVKLEAEYVEAWKITPARDTDARERLWQAVQIVGKVRSHIVSVANNGKIARKELDALTAEQRRKRFGIL